MSLFGLLGVGRSGLQANTLGLNVASHNASNVATEGYSRRSARLEALPPPPRGGAGVRAAGSRRIVDGFVEKRLLDARTQLGSASARTRTLSVLDQVLQESAGGLGRAMDAFEESLVQLAAFPSENAARQEVLSRAGQLGRAFGDAAQALSTARDDANSRIQLEIDQVNEKLRQIGDLGKQIGRVEVGGEEASDLRDRRDQLLREVADFVPVKVIEGSGASISVLLSGSMPLVTSDGELHALEARTDATTGDVRIFRVAAGAGMDVSALVDGGSIGGVIQARDGALGRARAALDQLAFDIAENYNTTHRAGVGLDAAGNRNLFEPLAAAADAASSLQVAADVAGQPERVAAARDRAALPGDNRNALALQDLADVSFAAGGTATAATALSALIATAGTEVSVARNDLEAGEASHEQLAQLRESLSGVSLDEEMISLSRFQRAYQASIRVVQLADEMLGELMTLKR
ncbi:MAG: flagellar hook-associated protein FlgK [Proteobacteria bacterium]|nr:flagellar hook-associated protein FlgK [Pseudomonadota bacterium]